MAVGGQAMLHHAVMANIAAYIIACCYQANGRIYGHSVAAYAAMRDFNGFHIVLLSSCQLSLALEAISRLALVMYQHRVGASDVEKIVVYYGGFCFFPLNNDFVYLKFKADSFNYLRTQKF